MSEQIEKEVVEGVFVEEGKRVGDLPYWRDYGYTDKEWSFRLELDRMTNDMWKGSGYVFNTEEDQSFTLIEETGKL